MLLHIICGLHFVCSSNVLSFFSITVDNQEQMRLLAVWLENYKPVAFSLAKLPPAD